MKHPNSTQLYDAARLAAAIGADRLLSALGINLDGPLGPYIGPIAEAFLAAVIIIVLTDAVFGRPRIEVLWLQDRVPQLGPTFVMNTGATATQYIVQINCRLLEPSSAFKLLARLLRLRDLNLKLTCSPATAITFDRAEYFSGDNDTATITRDGSALVFHLSSVTYGAPTWVHVGIAVGAAPSNLRVSCEYAPQVSCRFSAIVRSVYKVDAPITHIEVTRSSVDSHH